MKSFKLGLSKLVAIRTQILLLPHLLARLIMGNIIYQLKIFKKYS